MKRGQKSPKFGRTAAGQPPLLLKSSDLSVCLCDVSSGRLLWLLVNSMALSTVSYEDEAFPFEESEEYLDENECFGGQPYRFEPIGQVQRPERASAPQNPRSELSTEW